MFAAVNVASKRRPFLCDFPVLGQTEHLVTATVRQDGTVLHLMNLVQPPHLFQYVGAGTQVKVVRVAQDDVGVDDLLQFWLGHGAYGTNRSHRHENGRLDVSMICAQQARARLGRRVLGLQCDFQCVGVDDRTLLGGCPSNPKGNFTAWSAHFSIPWQWPSVLLLGLPWVRDGQMQLKDKCLWCSAFSPLAIGMTMAVETNAPIDVLSLIGGTLLGHQMKLQDRLSAWTDAPQAVPFLWARGSLKPWCSSVWDR